MVFGIAYSPFPNLKKYLSKVQAQPWQPFNMGMVSGRDSSRATAKVRSWELGASP
jgi:hypothetical protein